MSAQVSYLSSAPTVEEALDKVKEELPYMRSSNVTITITPYPNGYAINMETVE